MRISISLSPSRLGFWSTFVMSHQASSAGLSYLDTHHFPDWFDDNVSAKGLLPDAFFYLFL